MYLLLEDRRIPKALDHELKTRRSLKSRELVLSIERLPQRIIFTMTNPVIAAMPEEEELIKKTLTD